MDDGVVGFPDNLRGAPMKGSSCEVAPDIISRDASVFPSPLFSIFKLQRLCRFEVLPEDTHIRHRLSSNRCEQTTSNRFSSSSLPVVTHPLIRSDTVRGQ